MTRRPEDRPNAAVMLLYLSAGLADEWTRLQPEVEAQLREGGPDALLLLHEQV